MQSSTFVQSTSTTYNPSYQLLRKLQIESTKCTKQQQKTFHEQFQRLSDDERQEWIDNMLNKCYMSYKQKRFDMLKEDIVFVVYTAQAHKLDLPKAKTQELLKKTFLDVQSKDSVKGAFVECGIDISDYELLYYRDPEQSTIKSLFSCCL